MANNVGLEFAAKTDTGLVRSQNEDSIAISPMHGFAILADGMGGYNAGEVASSLATTVIKDCLEQGLSLLEGRQLDAPLHPHREFHQLMSDSIHHANLAILEAAHNEPRYGGMGTTVIAALVRHDRITIAHVGDSRAYRFRMGELEQITRDHSLLQEQIDAGMIDPEWAHFSQNRNLVTRAVGVGLEMEVEIHDHHIEPGDIYLLCSDGLSDMLRSKEIGDILTSQQTSLKQACDVLVQRANDNGGHDNISVILVRVQPTGVVVGGAGGLLGRIKRWVT